MTGVVFFRSANRDRTVEFYEDRLGAERWLEQEAGCTILAVDNLLVGFCDGDETENDGTITKVLDDASQVDRWHERLEDVADHPPTKNEDFDIYHFYATDPDGRAVEVQTFLHEPPERAP